MTDQQIAWDLVRAVDAYRPTQGEVPENYDAEHLMFEAEDEICERLSISPDETEQGLTENAVARIERFVSDALGEEWTYGLR